MEVISATQLWFGSEGAGASARRLEAIAAACDIGGLPSAVAQLAPIPHKASHAIAIMPMS
jgi:hypothetical protein